MKAENADFFRYFWCLSKIKGFRRESIFRELSATTGVLGCGGDRLGVLELREASDQTRGFFGAGTGAIARGLNDVRAPDHIRSGGFYGSGQSRAA
jgi:hypothetical protein